MSAETIKSYLVRLGYEVDQPQWDKFKSAVRTAGEQVSLFTSLAAPMSGAFVEAGVALVAALSSIATGTVALMESTARADLGYQMFARRMYMSVDAAKQLKIATDALGFSLSDIIWGPPEVRERYQQLIQDQKKLQAGLGGASFETEMRKIRDISFEFTRMKVEAQYFVMGLTKALSKALTGDENGILERLRSWNKWLIKNIPELASKFSDYLAPVLKDAKRIWGDIADIGERVTSVVLKFIGALSDDDGLKEGQVSIDNIGLALDHVSSAILKVMDGLDEVAKFITEHPWALQFFTAGVGAAVGGAVGGLPGAAIGAVGGGMVGHAMTTPASENPWTGSSKDLGVDKIKAAIVAAAIRYRIDPNILLAIGEKESGFHQYDAKGNLLVRAAGDTGVMQLIPSTAREYGVDSSSTLQNIKGGAHFFSDLLDRAGGDYAKALAGYNGGYGTRNPKALAYAEDVMQRAQHFHVTINATTNAHPEEIGRVVTEHVKRMSQRSLVQAKGVGVYA